MRQLLQCEIQDEDEITSAARLTLPRVGNLAQAKAGRKEYCTRALAVKHFCEMRYFFERL